MSRHFRAFVVAGLFCLASCSGGAPSKDEVRDFLASQSIQISPFAHPSQQAIDNATEGAKKLFDVQGLDCAATKGFKNVWDCTVNVVVSNDPRVLKFRFHRDQNGKLAGERNYD